MIEQRKQEEGAWYRQQEQLMDAEDQRRKMIEVEDKKLSDQRTRYVIEIRNELESILGFWQRTFFSI